MLSLSCAHAVDLIVDKTRSSCTPEAERFCTIQSAIDAASNGDRILIKPSRYVENLDIRKSVELRALADGVILDGNYKNSVIAIAPAVEVSMHGLRVLQGWGRSGGGIYNQGKLRVENCVIEENIADESGGGVYSGGSLSSSLSIVKSVIRLNLSLGDDHYNIKYGGGGIFNDSPMLLKEVGVTNNLAVENGGGIYSSYTFRRQASALDVLTEQMGIASQPNKHTMMNTRLESGSVQLSRVNIADNSASNGGGMYVLGIMSLNKVRITGNRADRFRLSSGGGMFAHFNAGLTLENSVVMSNHASFRGGGIRFFSAHPARLFNTSILNNSVQGYGRGAGVFIQKTSSPFFMSHSVLADNVAGKNLAANCYGDLQSSGFNFIQQEPSCKFNETEGDLVGNASVAPGVVYSRDGAYFLRSNSPLIDRGSVEGCLGSQGIPAATDLNGRARIVDGNLDGQLRCDIGAIEYSHSSLAQRKPNPAFP